MNINKKDIDKMIEEVGNYRRGFGRDWTIYINFICNLMLKMVVVQFVEHISQN